MKMLNEIIDARSEKLFFYSPYNFIKKIKITESFKIVTSEIEKYSINNNYHEVIVDGFAHYFLVKPLPWDTGFFNVATYKLYSVLYDHSDLEILTRAVNQYLKSFEVKKYHIFIEIPPEDSLLIQGLNNCGFKLVETRLTFFHDHIQDLDYPRFDVREAKNSDIARLRRVAGEMRNIYDRFHSDTAISNKLADDFLREYIEQSIKGLSDLVIVPDMSNLPIDSFMSADFLKDSWGNLNCQISRIVLTAVAPANKGWHVKLMSEISYLLKEIGAECIIMTTQSTNRAVFKSCDKLGYKLGGSTHILSISN